MILSRQSFPSDTESADTKAENSAAATETSLQTSDMEPAKAPATPHTSPQTDVAGITKPERQEQAEGRILRTGEPIHSDEPQPTKEEGSNSADKGRESTVAAAPGNNHNPVSVGSATSQEGRKKRHHRPVRNGILQRASLKSESQPATRHMDDDTGNHGKQKTAAETRKNCKPKPIHPGKTRSQRKAGHKKATDTGRESNGQVQADVVTHPTCGVPHPDNRNSQGHSKASCPDTSPNGNNSTVGTRKKKSLSAQHPADPAESTKAERKTIAQGRGKRTPKPTTAPNTAPTQEGRTNKSAGGKLGSKVVPNDTGKKTPGGLPRHANSQHRNAPSQVVYDPLIGRHIVPVCNCTDLMERIIDDTNFLTALRKVNSKPDKAAGIDRRTVREVCEPLLNSTRKREKIRKALLRGKYTPAAVRTTSIPKKDGKRRALGIAIVRDRIVQKMILQAVTALLPETPWSQFSFAYQAKRSVANAIAEVNNIREEGYRFCVTLDLKSFFDNVPHDRLLEKLRRHLRDPRVTRLVKKFLTPVIATEGGALERNRIGTPQGSVLSPWLASDLYLDEFDQELARRGSRFVRYADDITVFCRSRSAAKRVKTRLIKFLEDTMKCPVNREKTHIVDIRKLAVLGVYLDKGHWHIQREKEQEVCGEFLHALEKYAKSKDLDELERAVSCINGFLQHYWRIPGLAKKEVRDINRWCVKKWISILGRPFGDELKSILFLRFATHC